MDISEEEATDMARKISQTAEGVFAGMSSGGRVGKPR